MINQPTGAIRSTDGLLKFLRRGSKRRRLPRKYKIHHKILAGRRKRDRRPNTWGIINYTPGRASSEDVQKLAAVFQQRAESRKPVMIVAPADAHLTFTPVKRCRLTAMPRLQADDHLRLARELIIKRLGAHIGRMPMNEILIALNLDPVHPSNIGRFGHNPKSVL